MKEKTGWEGDYMTEKKKLTKEEIDEEYKESKESSDRFRSYHDEMQIKTRDIVVEDSKIYHLDGMMYSHDNYAVKLSGYLRHDYPLKRGYTEISMHLNPVLSTMLQWLKIWLTNEEVYLVQKAMIKHSDQFDDDPGSFVESESIKGMYETLTTVIKSLNRIKSSLEPFSSKEENTYQYEG